MLKRIALLLGCMLLLLVSWTTVLGMESISQKQSALIILAEDEIKRETYINAIPYLTEAVSYNTNQTFYALGILKDTYRALGEMQKYANVLKGQIAYEDCPAEIYGEYACHYIAQNKLKDALETLKLGIKRTNDDSLKNLYEENRYAFTIGWDSFDDVTAFHSGGIQIMREGLWGLANNTGRIVIPCEYRQISTFDPANGGSAVAVRTDKKAVTLNMSNQPIAIMDSSVSRIGNLSQNIVPLQLTNGKWIIADSQLVSNNEQYDDMGTFYNSALALKIDGRWGVLSLDSEVIVPFEYDEIVMDELGRCYAQNAVFAKKDGKIYLIIDGSPQSETYEDARPFANDGWAAVKKNGKWGFVNTSGEFMIAPQFEDALSFNGHLAAVKNGEGWGYISLSGKIVIEPEFIQAKSFYDGNAPVLTEQGWQFASLLEFN